MNNKDSSKDKEYLSRQTLKEVKFNITENQVYIGNDNTVFINTKRINKISKKTILEIYNETYKTAKQQKIKIGRKGFKKYINENWNKYQSEIKHYNRIFDDLTLICNKVKERKLHIGTTDDVVCFNSL